MVEGSNSSSTINTNNNNKLIVCLFCLLSPAPSSRNTGKVRYVRGLIFPLSYECHVQRLRTLRIELDSSGPNDSSSADRALREWFTSCSIRFIMP